MIAHIDWDKWRNSQAFLGNAAYVALPEEKDAYEQQDAIIAELMTNYPGLFG